MAIALNGPCPPGGFASGLYVALLNGEFQYVRWGIVGRCEVFRVQEFVQGNDAEDVHSARDVGVEVFARGVR